MIRVVLVDDEEPARVRLRAMLAEFDDVEVVGEAQDGAEAIATIAECHPDAIFLDIQMPGMTGMQVAACLQPPRPRQARLDRRDRRRNAWRFGPIDWIDPRRNAGPVCGPRFRASRAWLYQYSDSRFPSRSPGQSS